MNIAIIPARKGSKGLADKNISILNGKPLILYTVLASIQSQLFDKIVVTTDDSRIIKLVKNLNYYNIVTVDRPKYLSTDLVLLTPVVVHSVKLIEKLYKSKSKTDKVNTIFTLQPTSPLRTANHIFESYVRYKVLKADSLVSVVEEEHNIYCNSRNNSNSSNRYAYPLVYHKHNRQQVTPVYTGNGAISICSRDLLLKHNTRIGHRLVLYEMTERDSVDIHTVDDLRLAEWYLTDTGK